MMVSRRYLALSALTVLAGQNALAFTPIKYFNGRLSSHPTVGQPESIVTVAMGASEVELAIDVSIPYDAAARLAYDEWSTKYGKGNFDASRYETFRDNYEAITIANVSAAKKARDSGASKAPQKLELNEYADMSQAEYEAAMSGEKEETTSNVLGQAMEAAASQNEASSALDEASKALDEEEQVCPLTQFS